MYKNSNSVISGTDSKKAKSEKKDCVVKAIASSTNVDYDTAHSWVKENFEREDKKGTSNWAISKRFQNEDMEIGGKKFKVRKLKKWETTNQYKAPATATPKNQQTKFTLYQIILSQNKTRI